MAVEERERKLGQWQQKRLRESVGGEVEAAEPAVLRQVQERVDRLLEGVERPVRILDAGCGPQLQIPVADERRVVGIDISAEQVGRNSELAEAIVGDIQSYPFEPGSFDVVTCWNVLEHVEDPRAALANFEQALASPGILVLAGPHPHSFKGTVTKLTPFWAHKLAWKQLVGSEPMPPRFPTHMADAGLPEQLTEILGELGMRVESLTTYEGWEQRSFRNRGGAVGRAYRAGITGLNFLSLQTIRGDVTDFVLVASK